MISSTGVAGSMTRAAGIWQTSMSAVRVTGRYADALQLLSINAIRTKSGSDSLGGFAPGGGLADAAEIASTYSRELDAAGRANPGSSDANQRHIAQYNTIMAHRGSFPPGGFYLHTELGDGASITTYVPPVGETARPPASSKISITVASIVANIQTAAGGVAVASLQAAYAEWS
jgi:hypothetical protein